MSRLPTGSVSPAGTCLVTRRAVRRVVTRVRVRGRPAAVLRRRAGQDDPAGGDPAGVVRIHLLDPTGALVPLVLDDPDRG
jgi:hypothetical protein